MMCNPIDSRKGFDVVDLVVLLCCFVPLIFFEY